MELTTNWRIRSRSYTNLEWAIKNDRVGPYIRAANSVYSNATLDVGCGPGNITTLLPGCVVIGVDLCEDMLHIANTHTDVRYVLGDCRNLPFRTNTFDLLCCRMVLHHMGIDLQVCIDEMYRVLSNDGTIIISEGMPPSKSTLEWWKKMWILKEERLTFLDGDIPNILMEHGFIDVLETKHISKMCSISNWLSNSGTPLDVLDEIYDMHRNMPPLVAEAYNAVVTDDDVLIDMMYNVVIGRKI